MCLMVLHVWVSLSVCLSVLTLIACAVTLSVLTLQSFVFMFIFLCKKCVSRMHIHHIGGGVVIVVSGMQLRIA